MCARKRSQTAVFDGRSHVALQTCKLICVEGPNPGASFSLDADNIIVGSDAECHVAVGDVTVSRQHFAIERDAGAYVVRDLGSTNGTLVNDTPIKEGFLRPGAVIRAGAVAFRFELAYEAVNLAPSSREEFGGLRAKSIQMREIFAAMERVAATEVTVLIEGETGTGKSAVARAVHDASPRSAGPFVVFDCGATVPNLMQSELFGHERGAFTGAVQQRCGALEQAHSGTLFIDELADLSLELQPRLLRSLEEREFTRVGSTRSIHLDCRVIAATQRNLWKEVEEGRFRKDLYFRLAVVTLPLPALKERQADIGPLVTGFLSRFSGSKAGSFEELSAELRHKLLHHDWPGNIRELRNVIEYIGVMENPDAWCPGRQPGTAAPREATPQDVVKGLDVELDYGLPFKDAKEQLISAFEREYLKRLLARTRHNIAQAAREAQINRRHLYTLLAKHGLGDHGSESG